MGKLPCCDKTGLKKGPWTAEEDRKLIVYIHKHGHGRWRTLPKNAGLKRCGKSCRLRWANYLRPDIKRGSFSLEEEETIVQLHRILGNKWSSIASRLPGRTDNEIKNHWNTHIRKRLLRLGIDPVTHTPRLDLLEQQLSSILYNSSSSHAHLHTPNLFGIGIGPWVDQELLNLATTFFSCQGRPEFLSQHQENYYQLGLLQMNQNYQFQSQLVQPNLEELQSCTTSNPLLNAPFQLQPQLTDFSSPNFPPTTNQSASFYDSKSEEPMINNRNLNRYECHQQACNDDQYQNFEKMTSFGSLLSTTPSPGPATRLTYVNGSSTEDERDSFCSNILNMYGFNVTELL